MDASFEDIVRPWDQRPDEPEVWYRIFRDYFLPLGERRSLRNAFEFYIRVETPKQYEGLDPDNITRIPGHWSEHANKYEWGARALAFDTAQVPDFSQEYVKQVLTYLRVNSMKAATALVSALNSDRTRVQAANSILGRVGVPETTDINLSHGVSFTSDDLAAAANKVDAWKLKRQSG